jgi:hypothetical protein
LRGLATVTALVFAGCNFSTPVPGETGGENDAGIDAKMIDGPPDDVDGDGVKNVADNCPNVANTPQFNEDGDSRGDECDPCPQLSAANDDADDDGDNIGNGCDPHRGTPGDVLTYWNGFHTPPSSLPTPFTMIHGQASRWSIVGGNLEFDSTNDDWGMPAVDVGKTKHTIDSTFQIVTTFIGAAAAGVAVDIKADDTDLFDCQARIDNGRREMWRRNPPAPDGWSALTFMSVTTPIDTYRIVLERNPTDLLCTNTRAGQISVNLTDGTDSIQNTRAGLFARNADVKFRYIAIYTSP